MINELFLSPSVDVSRGNELGAAAINILHGSADFGHEQKIKFGDYAALLAAYIILNDETVGLFIYDEDNRDYVHHQFISSRVERCLLAHAPELAAAFRDASSLDLPAELSSSKPLENFVHSLQTDVFSARSAASPSVLLESTLTHLTKSQRLYRKIRAIRRSNLPVYASKDYLNQEIVIGKIHLDRSTQFSKKPPNERAIEAAKHQAESQPSFISWLNDASDERIAQILDNCRLIDRPKRLKVLFETPKKLSIDALKVLDNADQFAREVQMVIVKKFGNDSSDSFNSDTDINNINNINRFNGYTNEDNNKKINESRDNVIDNTNTKNKNKNKNKNKKTTTYANENEQSHRSILRNIEVFFESDHAQRLFDRALVHEESKEHTALAVMNSVGIENL